jgi:hypothetical protein
MHERTVIRWSEPKTEDDEKDTNQREESLKKKSYDDWV